MDLQGAAYAYAPMGDDREEMESFRFWKGGYWANHLRGKPYHIRYAGNWSCSCFLLVRMALLA